MPETPEEFWERARAGLQTPPVEEWDTWPFEGAITPRELEPPVDTEPPRHGVGGVDCAHCDPKNVLWSNENWVLRSFDRPSGLPVVVLLETKRHVDFPDLDDQLAAGDVSVLSEWLRANLYSLGRKLTPRELLERVTGSGDLDPEPYLAYLRKKMNGLAA